MEHDDAAAAAPEQAARRAYPRRSDAPGAGRDVAASGRSVVEVGGVTDDAAAFAESDPRKAVTLAPGAHDDFVAILEKGARLAAGKSERLGSAPGAPPEAAA